MVGRRQALLGVGMLSLHASSVAAQETGPSPEQLAGRELPSILSEAKRLGLRGPSAAAAGETYTALDLADVVGSALARPSDDADALAQRAGLLLSELTRDTRDGVDGDPFGPASAAPGVTLTPQVKQDYAQLFRTAAISPGNVAELRSAARLVTKDRARAQYAAVEAATQIPWYVVGALHYREANLNFLGHLHNGDPLLLQTVHVPARRPPKPWLPPGDLPMDQLWLLSAKDALQPLSRMVDDWTVEQMCYAFEAYNGFGCRAKGIHSPYLWNYTQHYISGGFPYDHQFVSSYRSKQAGVVAILLQIKAADPTAFDFRFET